MEPTIEQVRRELDRRDGRPRSRCRGSLAHRLAVIRIRRWPTDRLRRFLHRRQVRFDPPAWARDCNCGSPLREQP